MSNTEKSQIKTTNQLDWIISIILVLLAIFFNDYDIIIAIQYPMYLFGLVLATIYFFQDGLGINTDWFTKVFPSFFVIIFFLDFFMPIDLVPVFALLKGLYYLLILFLLAKFLFCEKRIYSNIFPPYPLFIPLVFIAYKFASDGIPQYSNFQYLSFYKTLSSPFFIASTTFILMIAVILLLIFGREVNQKFGTLISSFVSLIFGLIPAILAFWKIVPSFIACLFRDTINYCAPNNDFEDFPSKLVVLFLYFVTLALYKEPVKFKWFAPFCFSLSFLLIYSMMYIVPISRAIFEILEYRETVGIFGEAIIYTIGFITGIMAILEFRKKSIKN